MASLRGSGTAAVHATGARAHLRSPSNPGERAAQGNSEMILRYSSSVNARVVAHEVGFGRLTKRELVDAPDGVGVPSLLTTYRHIARTDHVFWLRGPRGPHPERDRSASL